MNITEKIKQYKEEVGVEDFSWDNRNNVRAFHLWLTIKRAQEREKENERNS